MPNIKVYNMNNRQIVKAYGDWLGETDWDYFSTFTYRYDVKKRQNERLMSGLRENLKKTVFGFFALQPSRNYCLLIL